MNFPQHLLKLVLGTDSGAPENIHVATRTDVQWNAPVFRAPALPTAHQLNQELPFTENLRPLFGRRS